MTKVFYHDDFDGICSAAIINVLHKKANIKDIDFYRINYGQPFPWNDILPNEKIYMVDFCLQPFLDMIKLYENVGSNLIWIDHHKSALEEYNNYKNSGGPFIFGLRREGKAGCELTWEYFYGNWKIPEVVTLLGRYDVWDLNERVLDFQYGMRLENYEFDNIFWEMMFNEEYPKDLWIDDILEKGKLVRKWENIRAQEYCRRYASEVFFHGYRCIALNTGLVGSEFFESTFSLDEYDIFISYCQLPSGNWTVSFYSKNVDVSEIAKLYGGGGHKGAAGCQISNLDKLEFTI